MSLTQASPSQQWSEESSKTVTQTAGSVAIVDTGTWLVLTPGGTATHQLTDTGDRQFVVVAATNVVTTDPHLSLVQMGGGPIVTYIAQAQTARRLYATAAAGAAVTASGHPATSRFATAAARATVAAAMLRKRALSTAVAARATAAATIATTSTGASLQETLGSTQNAVQGFATGYGNQGAGGTWTAGASYTLTRMDLSLARSNAAAGQSFVLKIYSSTGTLLDTSSNTVLASSLTSSQALYEFDCPGAVSITSGTQYYAIVVADVSNPATDYTINLGYDTAGPSGEAVGTQDDTSAWTTTASNAQIRANVYGTGAGGNTKNLTATAAAQATARTRNGPVALTATAAARASVVAGAGSPFWLAHRPAGYTQLINSPFTAMPTTEAGTGEGWTLYYAGHFSETTDATAPVSPPNVGQWVFPTTQAYGSGAGKLDYQIPAGYTKLYVSFSLKLSANYFGPGHQKLLYIYAAGTPGPAAVVEYQLPQNTTGAVTPFVETENTGNDGNYWATTTADVGSRGDWHTFEVLMGLNDPGVANGLLKFWVDGTEYEFNGTPSGTNLSSDQFQLVPAAGTKEFSYLDIDLTYGGGGTPMSPPADQYIWFDHIYIAAST